MATKSATDATATSVTPLLPQKVTDSEFPNEDKPDLSQSSFTEYLSQFNQKSVKQALEQYVENDFHQRYPRPFIVDTIGVNWHSHALPTARHAAWNFRIRLIRMLSIISVGVILLIIATIYRVAAATIIGAGLLTMFTIYFAIIFSYVFWKPDGYTLYRVYSLSHQPDDWLKLNSGYVQLLYKHESIQSISELSAINGGITKTMLNTLGAYTWAVIMVHFAAKIYYHSCIFAWDIVDVLEFLGAGGLLIISIFELDPFRPWIKVMHYIGAALGCCTIAGYVIQQYHIGTKFWFSVVIAVVAGIGFILWQLSGIATDLAQCQYKAEYDREMAKCVEAAKKKESEVKISKLQCLIPSFFKGKDVNTYSRMNICFEAVFLYLGALSLCLWLFDYDQSCDIGCVGSYDGNISSECYP